ncbi:MAG: hypothetical protein Q8S73_38490 [Deltaproteobacteria bacterium]|nr:hypothetical protein [Myxococcales bacterium]MDP3220053.1 hypothetical protein [Deltaproteobacteria bacterium]
MIARCVLAALVGALVARGCAPTPVPATLVCPPQCEVQVEPAGGEQLRATCWCDR